MDQHLVVDRSPSSTRGRFKEHNEDFYITLYDYYRSKGLGNFIIKRLTSLGTITFIVLFSSFVFSFVQWKELIRCELEDVTCGDFGEYISWNAWSNPNAWDGFVIGNMVFMLLYWIWALIAAFPAIRRALLLHSFLKNELHIKSRDIQTMEWEQLLVIYARTARISNDRLFIEKIRSVIMRNENYLVALIREDVLNLSCFCFPTPLTSSLYWVLHTILLSHHPFHKIKKKDIRQSSVIIGIVITILLPFAIIFLITFYLIKHAEEFHVHKNYVGPRTWTLHAKTLFREYNELPHEFENRMAASFRPASDYLAQFYYPVFMSIGEFISFVASAILSLLAVMTLVDESIVLHVTIGGRNLLFYIALWTFILAVARAFVPEPMDLPLKPRQKMETLQVYIKYKPEGWENLEHTLDVRDEVSSLFRLRIIVFLEEVLASIMMPFVLLYTLPRQAERIAIFFRSSSTQHPHFGYVLSRSVSE